MTLGMIIIIEAIIPKLNTKKSKMVTCPYLGEPLLLKIAITGVLVYCDGGMRIMTKSWNYFATKGVVIARLRRATISGNSDGKRKMKGRRMMITQPNEDTPRITAIS